MICELSIYDLEEPENHWVISDVAVDTQTGYTANNPLKCNQDSYLTQKDLFCDSSSVDTSTIDYEK